MARTVGVNEFISSIVASSGGISASNLYEFEIIPNVPKETGGVSPLRQHLDANVNFFGGDADKTVQDKLNLLCNEIQIPGVTYSAHEYKMAHKGVTQKMATAKVYNELDVSFFCDANSVPLKYFRAWQDYTMGVSDTPQGSYEKTSEGASGDIKYQIQRAVVQHYYDYYIADVKIKKLEKTGVKQNSVYRPGEFREDFEFNLYRAYPYTVSSMPYSAAGAQLVKVTVGFYYEYSHLFQQPRSDTRANQKNNARMQNLGLNDLAGTTAGFA
tara:strand:- start:1350 stop:2159 length:810 start_codon:yes stop_codon:yes gene_type:complete